MTHPAPKTKLLGALVVLALLVSGLFIWFARDGSPPAEKLDRGVQSESHTESDRSTLAKVAQTVPLRAPLGIETKSNDDHATSTSLVPRDDDALPCWLQIFDLETGSPLEHVKVTAELGVDQAISYTDEHGLARVEGLETQMRLLQLDSFGYSSVFLDTAAGHERAEQAWRIPMSRTATLIAHVRDPTGAVAPDVQVTLESMGDETRNRHLTRLDAVSQGTITVASNTDATGTVTIPFLPAGISFQATVFHPRSWSPAERIVLDPGEVREVDWKFSGGCLLRGLLLDQDERPVVRRRVWMSSWMMEGPAYFRDALGAGAVMGMTDEQGRFTISGVDPGAWWVGPAPNPSSADAEDASKPEPASEVAPLAQLVRIEEGQADADVTLHVDRGLYIRGRVVDADGAPALDAHVRAAELERSLYTSGQASDVDGSFMIGPLARGSYRLVASRHDRDSDSEVLLATAGDSGVVLHLRVGAEFSGQVIGEDGAGVSASMSVCDRESKPRQGRGMHTDQSGHFVLRGLPAGAFDVSATTDDGRIGWLERVGIAEGAVVKDVIVRVTRGGRIRVRHTGPERAVDVEVLQLGGLLRTTQTLRNLPVELTVPPGTVVIRARYVDGPRRLVERSVSVAAGETVEVVLEAGAR